MLQDNTETPTQWRVYAVPSAWWGVCWLRMIFHLAALALENTLFYDSMIFGPTFWRRSWSTVPKYYFKSKLWKLFDKSLFLIKINNQPVAWYNDKNTNCDEIYWWGFQWLLVTKRHFPIDMYSETFISFVIWFIQGCIRGKIYH